MEKEIINIYINIISRCGVPYSFYSFNGYKEERCCLEKKENIWLVYIAEHGEKEYITKCESLIEALKTMTSFLSVSKDQDKLINSVFESENCVINYLSLFNKKGKEKKLLLKKTNIN